MTKDKVARLVLKAYQDGYRHGIQNFAYWQDGMQFVDIRGEAIKLNEAVEDKRYNYNPPRI